MKKFLDTILMSLHLLPKPTDCDVNCHKKCEKLAANLCGVNQKLIVEALASVRRENQGAAIMQGLVSFAFQRTWH